MTIKLRGLLLTAVVTVASASAFAGTGGLIGERHAAFDLGYVDFEDGGHLWTSTLELSVPSSIRNLDLAFDVGYADGSFDYIDGRAWQVGASATGYLDSANGVKPFLTGRVGYEQDRVSAFGYSLTDSSFKYSVAAGVEIPFNAKGAIRVGLGYYDLTEYDDGDALVAMVGVNYWVTEKLALRAGYARDFEDDSNTFTFGLAVRY